MTIDEFLKRISSELRYHSPSPRMRVAGDEGLLVWRLKGVKTGVVVGPSVGGAFVFLQRARVQVQAVTECVAILESVFRGEIVEVEASGPRDISDIWLAHVDAPAVNVSRRDRSIRKVDVPVFPRMKFRAWPDA